MGERQIRVIRILNRSSIGGPVLNALFLTKYMAPEFETKLICGPNKDDEESADFLFKQHGVQYEPLTELKREVNLLGDFSSLLRLIKFIRKYKPDVVHTHAAKAGAIGRLAAFYCRVPVIVHTFHGHVFHSYFSKWKTQLYIWIERLLARLSTKIIAISELQKMELAETFRICNPSKIAIVPNGIDLGKFQCDQNKKREIWREKYGLQDSEIVVAIVGRLAPVKDHLFLTKVIAYMNEQNTAGQIRFFIIGDGECRDQIMMALEKQQISYQFLPQGGPSDAQVVLTSWEKEMELAYAGMDIALLTSMNEGTPMTLIEAHAAGKPVVATNVGGVPNVVLHNSSGYLVSAGEVARFADRIATLANDEALRNRFADAGRDHIMRIYSYHRLVGDMKQLYREMLDR